MNASKSEISPQSIQKHILLIQTLRIGDLIQTAQLAKTLKEEHPDIKVSLIARKEFITPVSFLLEEHIDQIYTLDTKSLFSSKEEDRNLPYFQEKIRNFVKLVNKDPISVSINLSFSKSSNYLHSLIKSEYRVGTYYDNQANISVSDKWSQYLFSTVMRGILNPYNLVDLYKNIVGVSSNKCSFAINNKKNHILLHPFASQERKRWKASKWSEVLYKILKDNEDVRVTIVGATSDKVEHDKIINNSLIQKYKDRINSNVGNISIKDIYNIFDEKTLFVGHDSAISHLAAAKGIQSLTISLGNARAHETAPYLENCYILSPKTKCYPCFPDEECKMYQCHSDIPYQVVNHCIETLLMGEEITERKVITNTSHFLINSVDIYKTKFSSNSILNLESIIEHNLQSSEIYRIFYRMIWAYLFNEKEETSPSLKLSQIALGELKHDLDGIKYAYELCEFGKKYSRYILEEISSKMPNLQVIKEHSKNIDEIDNLIGVVRSTYSRLSPIIDFLVVSKSNISGSNIVELSESSFMSYHDASLLFSMIYELANKTINENTKTKTSPKELR